MREHAEIGAKIGKLSVAPKYFGRNILKIQLKALSPPALNIIGIPLSEAGKSPLLANLSPRGILPELRFAFYSRRVRNAAKTPLRSLSIRLYIFFGISKKIC